MKIGELFVELGFNVKGADKLKAFETSMVNAANAATKLIVAMRILAGLKVPDAYKNLRAIKVEKDQPAVPQNEQTPDQNAPKLQKGLKDITRALGVLGILGVLQKLTQTMKNLLVGAAKSQFELNQFTKQTGMTRDQMKRWELLGAKAGMSAQDMQQQMLSLQDRATEILMGQRAPAAPSLGLTGEISSPETLIKQLAEATRGMEPMMMRAFSQAYGVDPRLVTTLQEFPDAMESVNQSLLLTKREADSINELNQAFIELKNTVSLRADQALASFSDELKALVVWIDNLLKNPQRAFSTYAPNVAESAFPLQTIAFKGITDFIDAFKAAQGRGTMTNNVTIYGTGEAKENARELKRVLSDSYYQRYSPYGPAGGYYAP